MITINATDKILFVLVVFGVFKTGLVRAEYVCAITPSESKVCEYGCCGNVDTQFCCFYWKIYLVVGAVGSGIVLMSCIVGAIIIFSSKSQTTEEDYEDGVSKITDDQSQNISIISIDDAPHKQYPSVARAPDTQYSSC